MLAWSILAGADYVMSVVQGAAYMKASGMTADQVAYFSGLPLWVSVAWTASVWGGFVRAVALLLRRRIAPTMFAVSVAGTTLYILYTYFMSEGIAAMGMMWFMPSVIGLITAALVWYAVSLARGGKLG